MKKYFSEQFVPTGLSRADKYGRFVYMFEREWCLVKIRVRFAKFV